MATVKISDVVVPEVLGPMASAEISNYLDMEKTGLVVRDYNNVDIKEGGHFVNVPFYKQIDQATYPSQRLTDSTSLEVNKISTDKDIGVVVHRGQAWGSRDLAAILSGDDPMKELSKQLGAYWAKDMRTTLINVLNGVFGTSGPLGTGATYPHTKSVGVTTGTAVPLSATNALQTINLLGDAMTQFDVVIMHSKVYTDIVTAQLVTYSTQFNPKEYNPMDPGKFLGMQIIVSDDVPVNTGTASYYIYTTYFGKKGSIYLGRQKELAIEHDRDILAKEDVLSCDVHFVPHVKLCKWNQTTTNPTNAQLATATYWTSVANDHKFIGLAALLTN